MVKILSFKIYWLTNVMLYNSKGTRPYWHLSIAHAWTGITKVKNLFLEFLLESMFCCISPTKTIIHVILPWNFDADIVQILCMIVIHYMYLRGLRRLSYGRYAFAISVVEGIMNVYYYVYNKRRLSIFSHKALNGKHSYCRHCTVQRFSIDNNIL